MFSEKSKLLCSYHNTDFIAVTKHMPYTKRRYDLYNLLELPGMKMKKSHGNDKKRLKFRASYSIIRGRRKKMEIWRGKAERRGFYG